MNCCEQIKIIFYKDIIWKIGRGDKISLWFDNWVENRNLVEILGVTEDSVAHPEVKVCEFIQNNSEWDVPKLRQFLNHYHIVQKIQGITMSIHETSDFFC